MGLSVVRAQKARRHVIPADWRSVLAGFPDTIREAWEERAAIIEYDGREPRPTAERRAFECIVDSSEDIEQLVLAHIAAANLKPGNLAAGSRA